MIFHTNIHPCFSFKHGLFSIVVSFIKWRNSETFRKLEKQRYLAQYLSDKGLKSTVVN